MRNFCTVADSNFYDKVCALNHSLHKKNTNYKLHLLCLDEDILTAAADKENVTCYDIRQLLESDPHLKKSLNNPPSREALINSQGDLKRATEIQFTWAMAPYFSWWCLDNLGVENILYIDADIYFYNDHDTLYNHLGDCSVGIVEHRCPYNPDNGKYNVGIVYFKNNINGYKCSTWWKNCLLLTDHEHYATHGICGDQKYLELFPVLFPEVKVLDPFIGHLAPWNFAYHQYTQDGIVWNGTEQDLLYCHFSNFKPDYEEDTYKLAPRHGMVTPNHPFIKKISDEYFQSLREFSRC